MVQGKWVPMGGDLQECLQIRKAVLHGKKDPLDDVSQSVIVYSSDKTPVGTGRIFWRDGCFWISDLCVLESHRRQGFGDLLVRLLLFKALSHSAREIRLIPIHNTRSFFEKYGFRADENGEMRISSSDVQLSHCGGNCATCGLCDGK